MHRLNVIFLLRLGEMKKAIGIIILGLLVCNVSFADPIILSCEPQDKKYKPLSFILDDKNKDVVFEGHEYFYKDRDKNGLMYDEYRIDFIHPNWFVIQLDRITGALKYMDLIRTKNSYYRCKKVNKTAF